MKILRSANVVLVVGLFFNLAFAWGDENRSERATENQEEITVSQTENQNAQGPRLGKYSVLSYGNPRNPIRLGHFELLSGGKYKFYDNGGNLQSQGKYRFDAAASAVEWLSGIFKADGWTGGFEITREGKTHNISLKRGTVGSNSTD